MTPIRIGKTIYPNEDRWGWKTSGYYVSSYGFIPDDLYKKLIEYQKPWSNNEVGGKNNYPYDCRKLGLPHQNRMIYEFNAKKGGEYRRFVALCGKPGIIKASLLWRLLVRPSALIFVKIVNSLLTLKNRLIVLRDPTR